MTTVPVYVLTAHVVISNGICIRTTFLDRSRKRYTLNFLFCVCQYTCDFTGNVDDVFSLIVFNVCSCINIKRGKFGVCVYLSTFWLIVITTAVFLQQRMIFFDGDILKIMLCTYFTPFFSLELITEKYMVLIGLDTCLCLKTYTYSKPPEWFRI